jgi:hypothetical protein
VTSCNTLRRFQLAVTGIVCFFFTACERVTTDTPPPAPRAVTAPAPRPASAPRPAPVKTAARAATDPQKAAVGLIGDCARKGWIARHKAATKGAAPTVGLVVSIPLADPTLDPEALRSAVTGALVKRGVKVVRRSRHPRVFAKDPSRSVRIVFSPGVGMPASEKGEQYSLRTTFSWKEGPGPKQRSYQVASSLVELKTSVEIWSGKRAFVRPRPTGAARVMAVSGPCMGGPAWLTLTPCKLGGRAYAVQKEAIRMNPRQEPTTGGLPALDPGDRPAPGAPDHWRVLSAPGSIARGLQLAAHLRSVDREK